MYPAFSDDGSSGFLNNGEALLEMKSQQFLKIFSNWWSQLNIRHPDEVETFHGLEINKKIKNYPRLVIWKWNPPEDGFLRWMKVKLITHSWLWPLRWRDEQGWEMYPGSGLTLASGWMFLTESISHWSGNPGCKYFGLIYYVFQSILRWKIIEFIKP